MAYVCLSMLVQLCAVLCTGIYNALWNVDLNMTSISTDNISSLLKGNLSSISDEDVPKQ